MDKTKVTCSSCGARYDESVDGDRDEGCPRCGDTDILEDDPQIIPGETKVTYTEISEAELETLREGDRQRRMIVRWAINLILLIMLAFVVGEIRNNHLDKTTHTETLVVVGFSWKSEVDVFSNGQYSRTETLEGTGR